MRRILTRVETCAWCAGLLCVFTLLVFRVEAGRAQKAAEAITAGPRVQAVAPSAPGAPAGGGTHASPPANSGEVIGRLDVPALGLRVPILDDEDPNSLRKGIGRMKGTAVPGGLGNLVLAGHRDTYFRPLRRVRAGMTMRVITGDGTFDYVVDSTSIVTPDTLDVLDIGDKPEMTLITCYPFDYIGAAPKRFIVHSHLVSVAGEVP